jgi:hypothetical protein
MRAVEVFIEENLELFSIQAWGVKRFGRFFSSDLSGSEPQ